MYVLMSALYLTDIGRMEEHHHHQRRSKTESPVDTGVCHVEYQRVWHQCGDMEGRTAVAEQIAEDVQIQ